MKIALYIDADGREQIVLTPQTKDETSLVGRITDESRIMTIYRGSFYDCQGGWTRQGTGEQSTIIVLSKKPEEPPQS
jgi:hypothetical protein